MITQFINNAEGSHFIFVIVFKNIYRDVWVLFFIVFNLMNVYWEFKTLEIVVFNKPWNDVSLSVELGSSIGMCLKEYTKDETLIIFVNNVNAGFTLS